MSQIGGRSATLLSGLWQDEQKSATRAILAVVVGSLLMTLSAKIQIPFWPVPMTMQTMVAVMLGAALGSRLAAASVGFYLLQGLIGLPVFAGGGGPAYFAGPTSGYLIGFLAAAWLVGLLAERGWDRSWSSLAVAFTLGTAVIFALGLAWLTQFLAVAKGLDLAAAFPAAVAAGLTPFIPGAVLKIALALALTYGMARVATR